MDTQKLILFLIFSTSMLFLWEAWQKETRPTAPVAAVAGGSAQSSGQHETPVPGEKLASQGAGVSSAENAVPAKPGSLLESGEKIV
ncbi:MAG TPA: membrane protein insertase YidC, partial [Nitrosospira sp.]